MKSKNSTYPLIVGRHVGSLRAFIQAIICGAGLLGGIAAGVWIVFGTGVLRQWEAVLITPVIIALSIAIVSALGLLGAKIGVAIAARMQP